MIFSHFLKNNRGFSLMELIAATALVAIGMVTLSTLTYIASAYSLSLREEFTALSQSYRLEYELRKFVSLAVRVRASGVAPAAFEGQFSDNFQCDNVVGAAGSLNCPADWKEVAVFLRENSTGGMGAPGDDERGLAATGIWYKKPTHDLVNPLSGGVVIDSGSGGVGNILQAGNGKMIFNQMAAFGMQRRDTRSGLASVTFNSTFRYHGVSQLKTWCPQNEIGGFCNFGANNTPNFYDNNYSFRISLTNNLLSQQEDNGSGLEMRVLGPIHFFKPITPRREN